MSEVLEPSELMNLEVVLEKDQLAILAKQFLRDAITPNSKLKAYRCEIPSINEVFFIKTYYCSFACDILEARFPGVNDYHVTLYNDNIDKTLHQEDLS